MSFAVFQQLTQSTVIDAALFASFTSGDATNLILSKGDRLEVYDVQRKTHKLVFNYQVPLYGRPQAISTFRPAAGGPDHIALVLRRSRYLAVLKHSPEFGAACTCGQHLLLAPEDPAMDLNPDNFLPQVAVDPENRCLAVRSLSDRVVVFPVAGDATWQLEGGLTLSQHGGLAFHQDSRQPPGLGTPFTISASGALRLHHLQDIAFLHGHRQPTAVILGHVRPSVGGTLLETSLGICSILVVQIDLADKTPHVIWSRQGLPHDIFRVVPLHQPVGGMLALGRNEVIYMKEFSTSFCQLLNPNATLGEEALKLWSCPVKDESKLGILLSGCTVTAMSPSTLLFSLQPSGRLYLAHLVLSSWDTACDIVWTSPGTSAVACSMCSLGEEYVFLAAVAGGSTLLKATPSKKKLPQNLQPVKRTVLDKENAEGGEGNAKKSEHLEALLQIHASLWDKARHIRSYNVQTADELQTVGSVICMGKWCRETGAEAEGEQEEAAPLAGTERLVFCSGRGVKGALHICQRAVPLESLTEFDLPAGLLFSAVWTVAQPSEEPMIAEAAEPAMKRARMDGAAGALADAAKVAASYQESKEAHRYAIVSGTGKTMVLETTDEINEVTKSTPLDAEATTLCAGCVAGGRLVAQVTPRRICYMWARAGTAAAAPSATDLPGEACGASVCDPFVAVRFDDRSLRLLAARAEAGAEDLSTLLPAQIAKAVVCASLYRDDVQKRVLLVVLTEPNGGTLRVVDLRDMREVFCATRLLEVPPVLRGHADAGCALDHLRALSDVCASLPQDLKPGSAKEESKADESGGGRDAATAISVELTKVDVDDVGPTLVVMLVGRPVLIYRAFLAPLAEGAPGAAFPYQFSLQEHDFLGLVGSASGPHHAVAQVRHAGGELGGVVVSPPHAGMPALWLAAHRNCLFVHPLPGDQIRAFAPLHAACCESGFFAVSQAQDSYASVAQVFTHATIEGFSQDQAGFDLKTSIPCAKRALQRTPHKLATRPADGMIALAVSEAVVESSDTAMNVDEDPLADDYTIVREPPVQAEAPPMARTLPRYELWLDNVKGLAKLGQYRFTFDADEHVLCMEWVDLPGFPQPSLLVGTGVNTGEDLTCRGRLLIFSTKDRDPGVLPAVYQRSLKCPVTVASAWGPYLVHSEGFKLFFEKWESSQFNKVAFFDGSMCITAMSSIKNFLLLGDLRRGLEFVQWKEEQASGTRNLRRLSRSPPSLPMTVLASEFVVCGKSLGLVALDHVGTVHLYQYSPHSDGREGDQLLRSCATFSTGFPCRSALRLPTESGMQSLFMASGGGELLCLKPIDDQVYRTITTLLGIIATRLPFSCGLNPRAHRHHEGPAPVVQPRKNIEDGVLLRLFAFLSGPLQAEVAQKMRLSPSAIMEATVPHATCHLLALAPERKVAPGAIVPK